MKALMLGNEAIARGAYEAGVEFAAAYPGTPSTEILENIVQYDEIYAEWSVNEKVALDAAIGAAYAGHRALAAMKHVGLNVAAESLFYSAYTGLEGGLVIVTADDPGMHSSQNEQDNRHYARFAKVPMLEPTDSQEARDCVGLGLKISEEFDTPVLLRTTTRIAHAKSLVELKERIAPKSGARQYVRNPRKYVMIPAFARLRHPVVEERLLKLAEYVETFPLNQEEMGDTSLGIVASGAAYQYAREVFPEASFLKLVMSYPLPKQMIRDFAAKVDRLVVVEELDPFLEEQIRLMGLEVIGKEVFALIGEFSPDVIRRQARAAGLLPGASDPDRHIDVGPLPPRPPVLCPGCPHRGVFHVLKKLKVVVNSDIGCYALGVLPPLATTDTIGCMGASIGVAHGANASGIEEQAVAVIGDSTFFHAGMPGLLNVVYNKGTTTVVIVDNRTTAMTGHQPNPATGQTLRREPTEEVQFGPLAQAMGVKVVETVNPFDLADVERGLKTCLESGQPAVLISRGPCVFVVPERPPAYAVDAELCNGCGLCLRIGCPAIVTTEVLDARTGRPKVYINSLLCFGCDLCLQTCFRGGIYNTGDWSMADRYGGPEPALRI